MIDDYLPAELSDDELRAIVESARRRDAARSGPQATWAR